MRALKKIQINDDDAEISILRTFSWKEVALQYCNGPRKGYQQIAPLEIMRVIYCMFNIEKMTMEKISGEMKISYARTLLYYRVYGLILDLPQEIRNMFDKQPLHRFHLTLEDATVLFSVSPKKQADAARRFFEGRNRDGGILRSLVVTSAR